MLSGLLGVLAGVLWVLVTARVKGWGWLRGVFMWPGIKSGALVQRVAAEVLTPVQRRGMAVTARLVLARLRCWQLGIKNHPR